MNFSLKLCVTAAFIFFMAGLFAGIWKYRLMLISENSVSNRYVDAAHRASFLYAFSSLLLGVFAHYSVFPEWINLISAVSVLLFFTSAVALNFINGLRADCTNQIHESKKNSPGYASIRIVRIYMSLLIAGETAGAAVLGTGALLAIWFR